MKRWNSGFAWVVVLACVSGVCAQSPGDDLARLKQANADLSAQLAELKTAYEKLEAEAADLRTQLAQLNRNNEDLQVQTRELTELAGLTPAGDRVDSATARFTSEYDHATDRTVVRTGLEKLYVARGSAADHRLSLAYSYPGQEMQTPPQTVSLFIQAKFSGGVYNNQTTAQFDIDGETVDVPIADYDLVRRRVRVAGKHAMDKGDETLTFEFDRDLLRRLARAIQVKITIGTVTLEPTRDQTALFRAIQRRIELGA